MLDCTGFLYSYICTITFGIVHKIPIMYPTELEALDINCTARECEAHFERSEIWCLIKTTSLLKRPWCSPYILLGRKPICFGEKMDSSRIPNGTLMREAEGTNFMPFQTCELCRHWERRIHYISLYRKSVRSKIPSCGTDTSYKMWLRFIVGWSKNSRPLTCWDKHARISVKITSSSRPECSERMQ